MNNQKNIFIGDYCTVNEGVLFNSREEIIIGKYVRISPYVQMHTGMLDYNQQYQDRHHINKSINIKDGVWLASGSIILPGVTIGRGSIISAGSIVNKDIGEFELWGGVPAKKIKNLPK